MKTKVNERSNGRGTDSKILRLLTECIEIKNDILQILCKVFTKLLKFHSNFVTNKTMNLKGLEKALPYLIKG